MTNHYQYRCVGCHGYFTLDSEDTLDPYEFDPACAWCGDQTGLPCFVPPLGSSDQDVLVAQAQATLMAEIGRRGNLDRKVA